MYVELRRKWKPTIELVETKEGREAPREVEMPTAYRWGRSFGGNLGFLMFAPYGWAIDFLSGNAWDIKNSPVIPVSLNPSEVKSASKSSEKVVIAPPISHSRVLSDAGAEQLESILKEKATKSKDSIEVVPYLTTLNTFIDYDYDFNSTPADQRGIYRDTGATRVFESQIERGDDDWIVKSKSVDTRTLFEKPGPTFRIQNPPSGADRIFAGGQWWSRLLPNTFGVDFVSERLTVTLLNKEYELSPVEQSEWWAQGLKYVGSIYIANTPSIRRENTYRGSISAVPTLSLSQKRVKAVGFPAPASGEFVESEPQFVRTRVSGGYGVEFGYQFRANYVFFDIVPALNWSEITWNQSGQDRSATRVGVIAQVELGYMYFFESGLLLRVFVRSRGEDTENWRDAFRSRANSWDLPLTAASVYSGISVAYQFEPKFKK